MKAVVHITYNEFSKSLEERILLVPGDSSKDIITTYTYDTNNNLISQTDPRGYTTSYTYDLYDRLIQTTDPLGTTTSISYYSDNTIDITTVSTSTGLILSKQKNVYDNFGNVVKNIRYLDPVNSLDPVETKYTYSKDNELLTTIDENGYTTTNTYDARGNKLTTTDPLSNIVGATYNKRDLKVTEYLTQSSGTGAQLTTYTYDADGRVTSSKNTLNKIKTFEYNHLGAVTKTRDEMNRTTDIERDYRGLMTKTTSYSGAESMITTYNYDDRGNLLSIIDPMNHTMSYQYDGINRNTKTIYPDSKEITLTYDKNSNVITRTDPNGTVVTNTYDTLNHLTNRSISRGSGVGGVTSEIYTYDALGRLTSAGDNTNPTGTGSPTYTGAATINLTFAYDALNRLTSENQKPIGGSGYTLGYTYTLASDLLSVVFPDTKTQSYTYDALHRPLTTTYSGQTLNTNTYSGILLSKSTYLNGKITNYTYDSLNRTKSINAGTSIFVPTYTYNDSSDVLSDATKSYTYDGYARLIGATAVAGGTSKEIIKLDKSGNRISYTLNTYTLNHSTNILDQYLTFTGGSTGTYTYDNNGNMKVQRGRTHIYDYNNRLIQINYGTGILSKYNYDVLGRRNIKVDATTYSTSKSATNPDIIVYVYNGDNVLSEYKTYNVQIGGTGALIPLTLKKNYLNSIGTDAVLAYDNEEGISLTSTGKVTNRYYYHTNLQGSVIAISTGTGLIVQKYSYNAYGKPYISVGNALYALSSYTGTLYGNSRLYTGREFENDTGYYYNRARYYSSDLGRFISRDPIGQNDQVNLYTYVANSPLKYVDRMGREKQPISKNYMMSIKSIDITNKFHKTLKENAKVMEEYSNIRDTLSASWEISDSYTRDQIKESGFRNLTSEQIATIPESAITELKKNPYKYKFFASKVRTNGDWDLKNGEYSNLRDYGEIIFKGLNQLTVILYLI